MIPEVQTWLAGLPWGGALKLFVDVSLKAVVICAFAGTATLLLRRSSAFNRNMIWVFALIGLIMLPAFALVTPVWNLPILPELGGWGGASYVPVEKSLDVELMVGPPAPASVDAKNVAGTANYSGPLRLPYVAWGLLIWLAGIVLYSCWLLITRLGIKQIVKEAQPAGDSWHGVLASVLAELDLQRRVKLLESNRVKAAITVGILNPKVVLPADTEEWTANRRRSVLSHELAHVKRWDTLIEAVAVMVTVVYWFNPLVWFAVRRHRIERERDCDNVVLRTGVKPSDYAELLMNIAADLGGSAKPAWQLSTISQGSNLKERLMCILNPKINRNRGNRRSAVIIGIVVLALILPLSTSGIWSSEAADISKDMSDKDKKAKAEQTEKEEAKAKADKKKKIEQLEKEKAKKAKIKKKKHGNMSAQDKIDKRWEMVLEQESSAAVVVAKAVKKGGIQAGIDKYNKLKTAHSDEYNFKEEEFNVLGYKLLFAGKKKEALGIFQLNVDAYPESWNTHDSLGEACLANGDYERAIRCYEKSLELNPKNDNGKKMLEKIKKKTKHQT